MFHGAMTLDLGTIELRGHDVWLRPLCRDDADALAAASGESRASYLYSPVPDGPAEAQAYVTHALDMTSAGTSGHDCTVRNSAYYSILAAEWPAVRASLRARLEARATGG
jgi:hypothetical protein